MVVACRKGGVLPPQSTHVRPPPWPPLAIALKLKLAFGLNPLYRTVEFTFRIAL
jgi:hypothetical protein